MKIKGPHQPGQRMKPGEQRGEGNLAAMRTWYVPDGVDTGPSGHRNPDARVARASCGGNKPAGGPRHMVRPATAGARAAKAASMPTPRAAPSRMAASMPTAGPRREGGFNASPPAQPWGRMAGLLAMPARSAVSPYGHPGNAPSFPSDHANPAALTPMQTAHAARASGWPAPRWFHAHPGNGSNNAGPRGPRPAGPRPGGNRGGPRGGKSQSTVMQMLIAALPSPTRNR